jgi:hypothetical protein
MRGRFSYYISPGALVEYKECEKGLNRPDTRDSA